MDWRNIMRCIIVPLLLLPLTVAVYSDNPTILVYVQTNTSPTTTHETDLVAKSTGDAEIPSDTVIDDINSNSAFESSHHQPPQRLVNDQTIEALRLAVEEGIMTTLFDSGYFVINSQPIGSGLSLNETTTSLWLRSLASDLGVNHLLFVDYHAYLYDNKVIFDGGYQYIEIARPGNLKHSYIAHQGSSRSSRKINTTAKNYGINIVNEILTN